MRHQFCRQPSLLPQEEKPPTQYKKHSTRKNDNGNPSLEFLSKLPLLQMVQLVYRNLELGFICALTQGCYSPIPGAEPYSPVALFLVMLLRYLLNFNSENQTLKFLRGFCGAPFLRECGLTKVPSNSTLTKFRKRLGAGLFIEIFYKLVAQAFLLQIIKGLHIAIDSTEIWAFCNTRGIKVCGCKGRCHCPRKFSDLDARWGTKNETYFFFGYKVHLIVDADTDIPIGIQVTPGNKADIEIAQPLVDEVTTRHHFSPENTIADAAYDAGHFYEYLAVEHHANGIIDLNPRNGTHFLRDDIAFDQEGTPHCYMGALKNWGWEEKRQRRKWRAIGCDKCLFRSHCNPSPYGRVVYTMPANDYRLFGKVTRNSEEWKKLYNKRTSVERVNSGLKGSHQLENLKVRNLEAVTIHATMSAIARLVQHIALAKIWNIDKFQLAKAA